MRHGWLLPLSLTLGACTDMRPVSPPSAPDTLNLHEVPGTDEGLPATLTVRLASPGRTVESLPPLWDAATLRLAHATLLSQPRTLSLLKGVGLVANGSGGYVATGAFGAGLRPASGYQVAASLWNGGAAGTLAGEKLATVNLVAGPNAVVLPIETYPTLGLTGFSPTSGLQGDLVTLSGQAFSVVPDQDQVTLGGTSATVTAASSVSLTATVPDLGPGSYSWQVQVGSSLAARAGFSVPGTIGARQAWVTNSSQQANPAIAYGPNEYFGVWSDLQGGGKLAIYGGRFGLTGTLQGSVFMVGSNNNVESEPALAYNPTSSQYLVAWTESFGGNRVRCRLVNAAGTFATGIFDLVLDNASLVQVGYASTPNTYLAVWGDSRNTTTDLYGQVVAANGTLPAGNVTLASGAGNQVKPAIAYSATANRYLLVWEDDPSSGFSRIRGQLVTPDGSLAASPFDIATSASANQVEPCVAWDNTSGDYMVAWVSTQSPYTVLAQRVSPTGTLVGGSVTLANASGNKSKPRIGYEPWRQKFAVVWGDLRGANLDVYGQYVAVDGTLWGGNYVVASGGGNQSVPDVATSPAQQSGLVIYTDSINGGDIYGQQIR